MEGKDKGECQGRGKDGDQKRKDGVSMGDEGLDRCWAGGQKKEGKGQRRSRGGLENQKWENQGDFKGGYHPTSHT